VTSTDDLDDAFQALASPHRRRILDIIKARPGINVQGVCEFFDMSRIAVMKHLKVLAAAELVVSQREGRSRELYINTVPIQRIYDRWTTEYSSLWASSLTRLKYRVESGAASVSQTTEPQPRANHEEIEH
jgi:DNA-binding transcriptional ArsR family regulator